MIAPRIPEGRGALFRCEHLAKDLPGHACLRRQVERAQVRHPKTFKLVESPLPLHGHCATGCQQGREIRAALSGEEPAGAREGATAASPTRLGTEGGVVATLGGPPAQDRIWKPGAVPDVPIAAAARTGGITPAVEAQVAARVRAVVEAARKVCKICRAKPLRADNTSGVCTACKNAPARGRAYAEAAAAKPGEDAGDPVLLKAPSNEVEKPATASPAPPPPPRKSLHTVPLVPGFRCSFCERELATRRMDDGRRICRDCLRDGKAGARPTTQRVPSQAADMTGKLCKCGCGRHLRLNNTSGYSGYCNVPRYAAGGRPPRSTPGVSPPPSPFAEPGSAELELLLGADFSAAREEQLVDLRGRIDGELARRLADAEADERAKADAARDAAARAARIRTALSNAVDAARGAA